MRLSAEFAAVMDGSAADFGPRPSATPEKNLGTTEGKRKKNEIRGRNITWLKLRLKTRTVHERFVCVPYIYRLAGVHCSEEERLIRENCIPLMLCAFS